MTKKIEILNKVIEILNNSRDLSQMLNSICISAVEITNADNCFIYLYNKETNELVLMGASSPWHKAVGRIKLRIGEGIAGFVGKSRKTISISQKAYKDKRFKIFIDLKEDTYEAILSVPITFNNDLVGVINVQHKEKHKYVKREKLFIEMLSKLVSGALERDYLYEQYKNKAEILGNVLDSILSDDDNLKEKLEFIIFKILKQPIKVIESPKVEAHIKSEYFSVILTNPNISDEQRKAISLILKQADLILKNRKLKDEIEERKLV
jgi:transcriptional regulator with GAF, ATPase, and Fis domain